MCTASSEPHIHLLVEFRAFRPIQVQLKWILRHGRGSHEGRLICVHDAVGACAFENMKIVECWPARGIRSNGTWLHQFINKMHYHSVRKDGEPAEWAKRRQNEREREGERVREREESKETNENIMSSQRLVNHLNKWWLHIVRCHLIYMHTQILTFSSILNSTLEREFRTRAVDQFSPLFHSRNSKYFACYAPSDWWKSLNFN